MISWHTRKRSEGSEYELPNWSWVVLEGNPPQLILGGFIPPVSLKSSRSLSRLIFVCCWGENKKETEASKGCTGKGLVKNEKIQSPTLKHMHAPTQAASWKALLSVRLSSWEERGLDRQRRKENRTRRFGFGSWFGAKEDECEKIWRGGLRCQIWCLSRSCGAVCQNAEGGEPNTVSREALSASRELLTLISVRALQLWRGVILALTWIDWCQTPPVLPKWALISFNVVLSKRCFQTLLPPRSIEMFGTPERGIESSVTCTGPEEFNVMSNVSLCGEVFCQNI